MHHSAVQRVDVTFSRCVHERSQNICDCCGIDFNHEPGAVHCSHLEAGRGYAIRWWPDAAALHCWKCHAYLEDHPKQMEIWALKWLGEERYAVLQKRRHSCQRLRLWDIRRIHKHLKSELMRMTALRKDGFAGRIDFEPPFLEEYD